MNSVKKKNIINFKLEYLCSHDEILMLVVKNERGSMAYLMKSSDNSNWETLVAINETERLNYFYIVVSSEVVDRKGELLRKEISSFIKRREEGALHSINLTCVDYPLTVIDSWRDKTRFSPLYTTPIVNILNKRASEDTDDCCYGHVVFEVSAPYISGAQKLAVTGNIKALGEWDASQSIKLEQKEFPMWRVSVPIFQEPSQIEYKFIIKDAKGDIFFEKGQNRRLSPNLLVDNLLISAYEPDFDCSKLKLAGFALPIFSMKSENSYGIGDFADLKLAIDWAEKTNQRVVQILPINDTTKSHSWQDSYPYSPISSIALNPMYLALEKIGVLNDYTLKNTFKNKSKELNLRSEIDYEAVDKLKWAYLRAIFVQEVNNTISTRDFINWFKSNMSWVEPYSFYCALRELNKDANFENWGDFAKFNLAKLRELANKNAKFNNEVMLHVFVQYHLHKQLAEAHEYAISKGIILKGDIQIGVDRHSVDVWLQPELFRTDTQIGAPPDDFAENGQNWGFPAYNWEEMAKDNYKWWRTRLKHLEKYFDAYRIDHLLGFFRIWEIPVTSKNGVLGYFSPALAYTKQELAERGFDVDQKGILEPFICEEMLLKVFTERRVEYIKANFFNKNEDGDYSIKEEYNSYKKLKNCKDFGLYKETKQQLISILADVLFVEENGQYHPRISAQKTFIYSSLSDEQKNAYNGLYDYFFYHRNNDFWRENVMKKMPTIMNATKMLVCVEDLGMIPLIVPEVIDELQLLALEVERMPKEYGVKLGNGLNYPYFSVATTSTHDMSPLRIWWEEDSELSNYYYNDILQENGSAPHDLDGELACEIVKRCLNSNSMLAVLPIQDWFAIDEAIRRKSYKRERINVPSDNKNQWKYRMHIPFERLIKAKTVNNKIKKLIEKSDRAV